MKSGCTLSAVALAACLALGACQDPAPSPPTPAPAAEPSAPAPTTPAPVLSAPTPSATPPSTPPPTPPAPSAQEPGWTEGRMDVTRSGQSPATLREVRAARNEGFDRVVFQFDGDTLPGYQLEFLDAPPIRCGSGDPTELAGQARLQVRLQPAQAHADGQSTVASRERTADLPVLVALKQTCDFEGEVTWALGLKQPRAYRVLELRSPARIVVDVRH